MANIDIKRKNVVIRRGNPNITTSVTKIKIPLNQYEEKMNEARVNGDALLLDYELYDANGELFDDIGVRIVWKGMYVYEIEGVCNKPNRFCVDLNGIGVTRYEETDDGGYYVLKDINGDTLMTTIGLDEIDNAYIMDKLRGGYCLVYIEEKDGIRTIYPAYRDNSGKLNHCRSIVIDKEKLL